MKRREFLKAGVMGAAAMVAGNTLAETTMAESGMAGTNGKHPGAHPLDELTVADLQKKMESGEENAASIAKLYVDKIEELDAKLWNSVIEINPDYRDIAEPLDDERKDHGVRGPLHGIPVLIKDNIDTADRMRTSAGSLALKDHVAQQDSFVAAQLRKAGAVIIGKTNLSEWANFRSTHSTSGWSGRGGLTKNPYDLTRNCSGSSSGTGAAVAASLCAIGVGTETDGSVVSPSNCCGLVGIKPTVGLIPSVGIIPISHTQDTAGPMARTVRDAAHLLGALAGDQGVKGGYARFLDPAGLKGARIGVARNLAGFSPEVDKVFETALTALKEAGAILDDPANFPTKDKFDDPELEVLLYEFKAGLNAYLAGCHRDVESRTLKALIEYNEKHKDKEMPHFGQELFIQAEAKGPLTDKKYLKALTDCQRLSRKEGIDKLMDEHKLDAFVAPTGGPAWVTDLVHGDRYSGGSSSPAAVSGYPHITVPAGYIQGLPVGLSFIGQAWGEGKLIQFAYAFEQETKARVAPK